MRFNLKYSHTQSINPLPSAQQDTLVAMEALVAFTKVDPNRNVFNMAVTLESTATPSWKAFTILSRDNYTTLQVSEVRNRWCQKQQTSVL